MAAPLFVCSLDRGTVLLSRFASGGCACFLFRSARLFSKGSLAFFGGTEQSENIPDGYFPPCSYELSGLVVRSSCLDKSYESPRKNGARRSHKKHVQPPDVRKRDKRTVPLSPYKIVGKCGKMMYNLNNYEGRNGPLVFDEIISVTWQEFYDE